MSDDIVDSLRAVARWTQRDYVREAATNGADEIERLRDRLCDAQAEAEGRGAEIKTLRAAVTAAIAGAHMIAPTTAPAAASCSAWARLPPAPARPSFRPPT